MLYYLTLVYTWDDYLVITEYGIPLRFSFDINEKHSQLPNCFNIIYTQTQIKLAEGVVVTTLTIKSSCALVDYVFQMGVFLCLHVVISH